MSRGLVVFRRFLNCGVSFPEGGAVGPPGRGRVACMKNIFILK
jgi:hypothetical protein